MRRLLKKKTAAKKPKENAAKSGIYKAQAEEQIRKLEQITKPLQMRYSLSISATGNGVKNATKSIISAMSTSLGEGVTRI